MEPNQVNPSPENWGIPQGIPTGVFVPNNQVSAKAPTVESPVAPSASVDTPTPTPKVETEGALDKIFKWLAKFFAKITGQPDPITGQPNVAAKTIQKWENIIGKVRSVANQVVGKAGDVAGKAVDTVTNVTIQAAEQVKQIIPPQVVPTAPTPTSTVEATPSKSIFSESNQVVQPVVTPEEKK